MKQLVSLIFIFSLCTTSIFAQKHKYKKVKNSVGKGTFFFDWGYNRTVYSKSDIRFRGAGYDFTVKNSVAKDNPSKLGWHYLDLTRISVPQFNYRIGYYFKNHWAISFGQDHMKYIFADQNHVQISGHIDPGVDQATYLSGDYDNYDFVTNRNTFHYENSNGLNYLHFKLTRSDQWYETKSGWFGFTTNAGVSLGGILSFNDFTFGGQKDMVTISLSGYGISANVGLRLEFFQHVYLQANYAGGFMHQAHVKTRPNDASAYASQKYGFMKIDAEIGALFYFRTKNNCNSCPNW